MKCWVCSRSARGFGHTDARYKPGEPRRYISDWVFCSRRCQAAFHRLYGQWSRLKEINPDQEVTVIDPTKQEQAAMRASLRFFGEAASEIGFDKPLGAYSETEALQVIEAIITGYTNAMVEHHEATRVSPVGAPASGVQPDPMAANTLSDNPFAGLKDDLPWEDGK